MKKFYMEKGWLHLLNFPLKKMVLIVCLLAFYATAYSATYYVRPDGLDTNPGTSNTTNGAWQTIAYAAGVAQAGDIVNIQPGTYSGGVTFSKTVGSPITFNGQGSAGAIVATGTINITGSYYIVDNIKVTPPSGNNAFNVAGTSNTVSNCIVTGMSGGCVAFDINGSFNTVKTSTIQNNVDIDAFRAFGHDHTISGNTVSGGTNPGYSSLPWHADFFQSFGNDITHTGTAYNILIEGNVVKDNPGIQLGNLTFDESPDIHDFTFRNNVFVNNPGNFFLGIPNTKFYNNLFKDCGSNNGYTLSLYQQTYYNSNGDEFKNNVFINSGDAINVHSGSPSITVANNYFSSTSGQSNLGTNYVTGGSTNFVNANSPTYDFHIQSGSVLINVGATLNPSFNDKDGNTRNGSWDIGVDEYGGGGGSDTQAPTVPTGLTWSNKTQTSFTLSWTASTDNVGVTGYEVFKDGVSIGTTTSTSMPVTGLATNTTYSMTVRARDAVPNWSSQSSALNVKTLAAGEVISSTAWQTFTMSTQTGTFTAEYDAVPNNAAMDGVVGILNGTATTYSDNACSVRFNTGNTIDAINGSVYSSATTVNYTPGTNYHFRLVINVPNHTYSIYVTPQGQSQITLGTNFAFRTQQASVTQLTGWSLLASTGTHTVSNFTLPATEYTVFTTQTPASNLSNGPWEFAMRFQSSVAGQITKIRFYKWAGETGTHTGRIWSSTGTQLASVVFTGETASGWQVATLSSPVNVTANTTYIVSHNATTYGYTGTGLASAVTNGPLSTIPNGGAFTSNIGTCPTNWNAENDFSDVVFVPSSGINVPVINSSLTSSGTVGASFSYTITATNSPTSYSATNLPEGLSINASTGVISGTPTANAAGTTNVIIGATNSGGTGTATLTVTLGITVFTTQTPASNLNNGPWEFAMRFQSTVAGQITAIRFYKWAGETGTHTGRIWSSTGTQLASVVFTGETASGWQVATLSTPVNVTANTTYVVSHNATTYGYTGTGLASAVNNGPLSSIANGGAFTNQVGTFPSNWNAENDFSDVVFVPSGIKSASIGHPVDSQEEALVVYPNPAEDYVFISGANENTRVQLFNMQGAKVIDEINSDNKIDISALKPGMYLVKLDNKVFKLIKK